MFRKKTKIKKYSSEWYQQLFNEFKEDFNSRKINQDLYCKIKEYYYGKINDNSSAELFDINIERITLERKAGKYKGFTSTTNIQLIIVPFTMMLASLIQLVGNTVQAKYSSGVSFILACFMFIYILNGFYKENVSEKELIYHISLKILDDLEKELKIKNMNSIIYDEAAAGIQQNEQLGEQVRHSSNQVNGNWNVEISTLSILEAIESIFRIGKFARKIFRKQK